MGPLRLAGLVAVVATAIAPSAQAGVPATQQLVVLDDYRAAREFPETKAKLLEQVEPERPLTGVTTRLPVFGRRTDAFGNVWLHVRLPGRPNQRTGWIRHRGEQIIETVWHLDVSTSQRLLRVYQRGKVVKRIRIVVGKPATPTPHGKYFVEEVVPIHPKAVGAQFALATSARSNVLQEYAGGPGQIAFHGTNNIGGTPGQALSHGCMRMVTSDIRWLAARISAGIPVSIHD